MLSKKILLKKQKPGLPPVEDKLEIEETPVVDNAVVCVTTVAVSTNTLPDEEPRNLSPTEGRPAVNGQAEKLDIRPVVSEKPIDPGVAAIPLNAKKKPGRPKKESSPTK